MEHAPQAAGDKRRAPRARHDSVVELLDASGRRCGSGRLIDFSRVGMCFSSTESFEIGERLQALVRLLKSGRLRVSGRVVWSRRRMNALRYGVAFDRVGAVEGP